MESAESIIILNKIQKEQLDKLSIRDILESFINQDNDAIKEPVKEAILKVLKDKSSIK